MLSDDREIVVDFCEEAEVAQVNTIISNQQSVSRIQEKLKQKGFMTCEECGDDIPEERRKAYPAARTCVPCQTWIEKVFATT